MPNVLIISIYSVQFGLAPINRIIAYAKGLQFNGAYVQILNPFPTDLEKNGVKLSDHGIHEGIPYHYTSGRYKSKKKLLRALSFITGYRKILGYITSYIEIFERYRTNKIDFVIISTDEIKSLFFFSLISKLISAHPIFIFDEYPTPIRHKLKNKIPKIKEYLYSKVLKYIDAYISISGELKRYYTTLCFKPTFILPVIVDVSRFTEIVVSSPKIEDKYLCYMGNMELSKDDVDNIIKAFSLLDEKFNSIKLRLYGNPCANTKKYLEELIISLNLQDRVYLMGRVDSQQVPQILKNAYVLVSSQPNTKRAAGGFPTKLGEYLATGVPTLLTDVGENGKYVNNNHHVFFSKPDDYVAYAKRLSDILNNYDLAINIGLNGKKYILENYSHLKKGEELLKFLKEL